MRKIMVKWTTYGFHFWPNAPYARNYLSSRHRHRFEWVAGIEVGHDDREVEFHDFLELCQAWTPEGELGSKSCEMLAREVLASIVATFGRTAFVECWEDGEVGARVEHVEALT